MTTTERYNELKEAAKPNTVVLMRCGDFYETYSMDAKVCNDVLGLSLSPHKTMKVLTGFPAYKKEDYVAKLVRAGWRVAICDDTINNSNNNNNLKSSTTMETKNFAAIRVRNVYWFNMEREALVQLVIVRSNFKLDTGKVTHEWAEADGDPKKIKLMTDYDPEQPGQLPRFYNTPDDFEKGVTMKAETLYWMRDMEDICGELLKSHCCRVHSDEKGAFVWAFIKGQAVKWYFRKHIDVVTLHFKEGMFDHATSDDVDVPDAYYDAEDVYKYNDWTEVKPDGERVTHEGVYNRLRLEPDQVELADKLQAVLDECKEAGMKVYFNLCNYDLNAVNVRHIERIEYDPRINEDTEAAYHFEDDRAGRAFSGVYDLNTEDNDIKFVIKK